jgi:hypothetical protein
MDKRTEKLVEETVEKLKANIRKRAEEFRETDRKRELDINIIESIWHETRVDADRAIAELMNGLTGTIPEKEPVAKKNRKWRNAGK